MEKYMQHLVYQLWTMIYIQSVAVLYLLLLIYVSWYNKVDNIFIIISIASQLEPEITGVACTEENATVKWKNQNHNDYNNIWSYCVHYYCNTVNGVITSKTVSLFCA